MSIEAGNLLRKSREDKGVSIKEASDALHIRIPYLQALENGRAEIIPSAVQTRGFLRIYSEYLGLDPVMMIKEWDQPGSYPVSNVQDSDENIPARQPEIAPINIPHAEIPSPVQPVGFNANPPDPQPVIKPAEPLIKNEEQISEENDRANVSSEKPLREKKSFWKKNKNSDKNTAMPKNEQDLEAEAQKLFDDIGSQLAYRRKFLSLSLEDCESQTLIRSIYIESMENGKFDQLPSFIQARGMLNNYASFLDLDVDEIMLKLATALQMLSQKKNKRGEIKRKPTKKAGRMKQFFTPDLFIGIFVIVGIAGIIIYSAITIAAYRRNIAEPTPDLGVSLLDQFLDTTKTPDFLPTESATVFVDVQSPVITEEPENLESEEIQSSRPVQLFITANQRTMMTIITDGKEAFSGRTIPNNTYPFDAENQIELITGNADALSVVYNQQNLGRLGAMGEVMTIIFSPNMAATPTPQFSATPTNTLEPTYTPQPETPLPTNTPTPYIP